MTQYCCRDKKIRIYISMFFTRLISTIISYCNIFI
nr:MAG TPA: hypothetical protein [Caudoviricetes sp.]